MQSTIKIVFYWILIGVCFILHNLLHLSEIYYGKEMLMINNNGEAPMGAQIFNVLVSIMPFVIAVVSLNVAKKWFIWFSFVWSILLFLLNLAHLGETVFEPVFDISQTVLLTLVLIINLLLSIELWKSTKLKV